MTNRERLYPEIKRLREVEGLMWREIGERLGLSLKTVHDYYSDPDGSKARARARRRPMAPASTAAPSPVAMAPRRPSAVVRATGGIPGAPHLGHATGLASEIMAAVRCDCRRRTTDRRDVDQAYERAPATMPSRALITTRFNESPALDVPVCKAEHGLQRLRIVAAAVRLRRI
jgi:hypothetical protein